MKRILGCAFIALIGLLGILALRPAGRTPSSLCATAAIGAGSPQRPAATRRPTAARSTPSGLAGVLAAIAAETDPDRRSDALERAVDSLPLADLPAALQALAPDPGPDSSELGRLLVRRWAEADPAAAAAWIAQLPVGALHQAALRQVAIAWANTDLLAAANWLRTLPEGESKQGATLDLAYEAARTDPVAALDLGSNLPASPQRDDLLVHAVRQWADASAALGWARAVPDPGLRERLLAAVTVALANQDASRAAALAASDLQPGQAQDRAVVAVVQRWAQEAPVSAAAWVAQFPELPSRAPALQNLVALWALQDPDAAAQWLQTQAPIPRPTSTP